MLQALSKRVGLESHQLLSRTHSFNLVRVEDEYYYVDSTYLDNEIIQFSAPEKSDDGAELGGTVLKTVEEVMKSGDPDQIKYILWRKENPLDYPKEDSQDHVVYDFPDYIDISLDSDEYNSSEMKLQVEESKQNSDEYEYVVEPKEEVLKDEYTIWIKNKKIVIPGAVLMGILVALGAAKVVISRDRKREKQKEFRAKEEPCNKTPSSNSESTLKSKNDDSRYDR